MKVTAFLFLVIWILVYSTAAFATAVPIEIYNTGVLDPSARTYPWDAAFRSGQYAESFVLNSSARISSLGLWTYDELDGPVGILDWLSYAFYERSVNGSLVGSGVIDNSNWDAILTYETGRVWASDDPDCTNETCVLSLIAHT